MTTAERVRWIAALDQRIATRFTIKPMDLAKSAAYLKHHLHLSGVVVLAVFGERRPTRDIDLQAQSIGNEPGTVRAAITGIAATRCCSAA